jgi:hypothetical protein
MKKINTLKKISAFFKNIWNRFVIPKYTKFKKERDLKLKLKDIKDDFEKRFNLSSEEIKEIMYHKIVVSYRDDYEKRNYLKSELVKGREHVLNVHKYASKTPFLYEPDVVDIHNENLHLNTKTLGEIIKQDNENVRFRLKEQSKKAGDEVILNKIRNVKKPSLQENSASEPISDFEKRMVKKEETTARLNDSEKTLSELRTLNDTKEPIFKDIESPIDINIDNFPIIKKLSGKDKK